MSDSDKAQEFVEEATLDFTCGDADQALKKLDLALKLDPHNFDAWHALTEIQYAQQHWDQARLAAEKARELRPQDIHIHTSLSRIWLALGSKEKAEHWGAEARRLSWKEQLTQAPDDKETTVD